MKDLEILNKFMEEKIVSALKEISRSIKSLVRCNKKDNNESAGELLLNSFNLIKSFYIRLFLALFIFFVILFFIFRGQNFLNLIITAAIIFFGNLVIAIINQIFHYIADKNEYKTFAHTSWSDCFIRCFAGISEMIFYAIAFATNAEFLIAGYLIMKSVSIWKSERDPAKEGRHTAVHRIAVVLSLIFSLCASYFLFKYLQSFHTIFNLENLNKYSIFKN